MIRWQYVEEQTLFDMTVKMYRDPYVAKNTFESPETREELDFYAFKYLQSELHMYRIMDVNWDEYIEARGDLDRIKSIKIPTITNDKKSIL